MAQLSKHILTESGVHLLTYNGVTNPMGWWARELGMAHTTLMRRLKRNNWDLEKACAKPLMDTKARSIEYNGETHSINQWSKITGISVPTLAHRFIKGWDAERALTTPPTRTGRPRKVKD